ncbi:MAG: alkaline shock response membrane anchor protein AmaP [Actinomycetota bacterium]|nr:alkaline shock response membrane anchor protein AmaP [Actinomycetota bacterium]
MHADRTNRPALAIFGLLVLAAGGFGITASAGGFGTVYSHRTLLANQAATYAGKHGSWIWWAAAGAGLLIFLIALRWILVLLSSTDRVGDITVPGSRDQGTTVLHPAALTGALAREIETYHGVAGARARVLGHPSDPEVVVTVTARPSADLHALHRRLESEALAHARQALGQPDLPIQLDLDVTRRT